MIPAGGYKHKIGIFKPIRSGDGQGGKGKTYIEVRSAWAMFKKPRTSHVMAEGGPVTVTSYEMVIRYDKDICLDIAPGWMVRYRGIEYKVEQGYTLDNAEYTLICSYARHFA